MGNQSKDINAAESGSSSGQKSLGILASQVVWIFASIVARGEQAFPVETFNHFSSVILPPLGKFTFTQ